MTTASEPTTMPPAPTDHEGRTIDQDPLPTGDFAPADPPQPQAPEQPQASEPAATPPAPVVVDAEPSGPAAGETLPAVRASTDVVAAEEWPYAYLDFKNDKLGIRIPTQQAMSGLALAMGKFVPRQTQNDISGLFVARHLSPASFEHFYSRVMDPDDTEYTADTVGQLVGAILEKGVEKMEKDLEEQLESAANEG